jgi:hypothetical protein
MRNKYSHRFISSIAFMIAGSISGLSVILYDLASTQNFHDLQTKKLWIVILYLIVPGSLASSFGFIIGGDILDSNKVKTSWQAGVRGLYVSVASWLVYAVVMTFVVESYPNNSSFVGTFILILLFGSALIGWWVAVLGIVTGLLLYRIRSRYDANSRRFS